MVKRKSFSPIKKEEGKFKLNKEFKLANPFKPFEMLKYWNVVLILIYACVTYTPQLASAAILAASLRYLVKGELSFGIRLSSKLFNGSRIRLQIKLKFGSSCSRNTQRSKT